MFIYFAGIYHFGWYIVILTRYFYSENLRIQLEDCRTIFRILNENKKIFNKENVEKMNTTELLEDVLHNYDSSESDSDKEIEVSEILTSLKKTIETGLYSNEGIYSDILVEKELSTSLDKGVSIDEIETTNTHSHRAPSFCQDVKQTIPKDILKSFGKNWEFTQ